MVLNPKKNDITHLKNNIKTYIDALLCCRVATWREISLFAKRVSTMASWVFTDPSPLLPACFHGIYPSQGSNNYTESWYSSPCVPNGVQNHGHSTVHHLQHALRRTEVTADDCSSNVQQQESGDEICSNEYSEEALGEGLLSEDESSVDESFMVFMNQTAEFKRNRDLAERQASEEIECTKTSDNASLDYGEHVEEVRELETLLRVRYNAAARNASVWPAFPLKF